MTDELTIDSFTEFVIDPSRRVDPYPFYKRMRETDPVHLSSIGVYLLSRYEDVAMALRDPRFSSDEHNSMHYVEGSWSVTPFGRIASNMLLFKDAPDHKRLRDLVQQAFTRRMIEGLRPRIERIVDGLVEELVEKGRGDLIADYAYPLPVIVICELLGVPLEDQDEFHEWAPAIAARFDVPPFRTAEDERLGDIATERFCEYMDGLIETKRQDPADDLLSSLVAAEDGGDRLSHDELLATAMLLLFAGHETTANLIGNAVYALMEHREQWDMLRETPELVRGAVDELLRYDSPVQLIQRIALGDTIVGTFEIPAGAPVALMLGAANRDPDAFPDPDRLDVQRADSEPLTAFGGGVHFCLGAPLARMETRIALDALTQRVPALRIDGEPERRPSMLIRGFKTLPVAVA